MEVLALEACERAVLGPSDLADTCREGREREREFGGSCWPCNTLHRLRERGGDSVDDPVGLRMLVTL